MKIDACIRRRDSNTLRTYPSFPRMRESLTRRQFCVAAVKRQIESESMKGLRRNDDAVKNRSPNKKNIN
jgi:hypothetical protein